MKLTNKVTNIFFAVLSAIGLFMPLIAYSTSITSESYSIVDLFDMLKGSASSTGAQLLDNLTPFGYRGTAIAVVVAFIAALLFLLLSFVLGFTNVPYPVLLITTGLSFVGYLITLIMFNKIGKGFESGMIPLNVVTSLAASDSTSVFASLLSSFVNVRSVGVGAGIYVGMCSMGFVFLVNGAFVIFRKKIALMDEASESGKNKKAKKNKRAKNKKRG